MSQSRFSIVLVGVSALLRRPLVSRLRPADGERSSWVVFTARVGRFDSGFRSAGWPSGSLLPLFGMRRFGDCPRRVGLRAHRFHFSACTVSEIPLGELAFGLPLRRLPSAGWPSGSPLSLFGMHRFGDSARRVGLRASASEIALGGLAFGLIASAFRHAPLRRLPSAGWFFRSASWASGSPLPLFGTHRSAPPRRRREDRRSTTTRQLFHFKTLIPTC